MAAVKGKNTQPELRVRKLLHRLGYRFRLHASKLPGKPDIVLARHRLAVFVHGCFWHRHAGCPKASMPAARREFWSEKFSRTVERDSEALRKLSDAGWSTLVIWECETCDESGLRDRLLSILRRSDVSGAPGGHS
jgi:DNA mismatch endonuclease (patch repair protein)